MGDQREALLGLSVGFWKVSIANFFFFAGYYVFITTVPLQAVTLGASPGQMGIALALSSATQIPIAILVVGPRINLTGRRPMLVFGCIIYVLVALGLMLVTQFSWFLVIACFVGLANACFSGSASTAVLAFVPEARQGEAIGIFGTLTTLAILMSPPLSIFLFKIHVWAAYLTVIAGALIAMGIVATVKEPARLPAGSHPGTKPAVPALSRFISREALPGALLILATCIMYGDLYTYYPKYMLARGVANPGFFFTFAAASILVVRFWAGKTSDRVPKWRLVVPAVVAMILVVLVLGFGIPFVYTLPLAVLFGCGYGITYPVTQALMAQWAPADKRGTAMVMFSAAFTTGMGLGPLLMSPVVATLGLQLVFPVTGILGLALLLVFVRALARRQRREEGAAATMGDKEQFGRA